MQLFGIIGHPLTHTLSPTLHNWALKEVDIPASYHIWDTPPQKLADFMAALRTLPIHGLSVTIPHKEAVIPYLDALTETAKLIGAVNTLYWEDGRLWGDNTDVAGFMTPLNEQQLTPGTALVLGAGGAARAVVGGLRQAGWEVVITARTTERAKLLAQDFSAQIIAWDNRHEICPNLLVNTTPLGMCGPMQGLSPWEGSMQGMTLVYDLIYNPRRTILLTRAEQANLPILSGLPMFVHQGLAQFTRWTGQDFNFKTALNLLTF